MKTNLLVIYGGKSAEHDVSLKTALTVINAADRDKYDVYPIYITRQGVWCSMGRIANSLSSTAELCISTGSKGGTNTASIASSIAGVLQYCFAADRKTVVFPVIHGTYGEDGTLQGLLEMLGVPYVGNGVLASAAGMDKQITKEIMARAGIPQAAYRSLLYREWEYDAEAMCCEIEQAISYPCYVKPANLGSSIGIERCTDRRSLAEAIDQAMKYDHKVVIEKEIVGREIQIAMMGNDQPLCSIAGEFAREQTFFDYDEKYNRGKLVQRIPAHIPDPTYQQICDMGIKAYKALGGSGLMRVDFFVTDSGDIYFNEVNTLPGFTAISMFPTLWNRTDGTTYAELIDRLIDYAMERHNQKQSLQYALLPEEVLA